MVIFSGIIFLLGASVGSFINVVAWRLSKGFKIYDLRFKNFWGLIWGRSFCDSCQRQLAWWENIPLFSFLILRGRCRTCHSPIPYWYPLIEGGTGIAFVLTYWTNWTNWSNLFILWLIVAILVFVFVFDALTQTIPDKAVAAALFLAVVRYWTDWTDWSNLRRDFLSAVFASLFLLFLHLITKGKGMGLGDVKFAFFMGFFLGWPKIILALYLSFILGAVFGLFLLLLRQASLKQRIAFGPFLVLGTLLVFWWGDYLWEKFAFFLKVG
jgi:prepilin signal peptidase PulO-like enzyme (type II secretory pathway)